MFLDAWMKQGVTDEVRKRSWSTEELNQLWYVAQASPDKVSLSLGSERDMFVRHLSPHTCGTVQATPPIMYVVVNSAT